MAVARLGARDTARAVHGVLSWPYVLFIQRYGRARWAPGDSYILNLSDPEVMATALSRLVSSVGATGVLATPPVDRVTKVDERGDQSEYDSRRDYPWRRESTMARDMSPERYAALCSLFQEAGVRRGFYGGILGRGCDCPRVAGLLAAYAYHLREDILFVCEGVTLALLACHEGDLHVHSSDGRVLVQCKALMGQYGLKVCPAGIEVVRG